MGAAPRGRPVIAAPRHGPLVIFGRAGQVPPPRPAPAPPPDGPACPPCASLPSAESADALVRGEPGAPLLVLRDFLGRALLVAVGIAAAGFRPVLGPALAGAAGIEVFVVAYRAWANARAAAPAAAPAPAAPAPFQILARAA